ncbi:hypothetical protein EGT07_18255 [Herbaspirillum sp. HC18]|nr:hypothetical protein EGT07_18255 [Herbaspirillum sp. HC18]
MRQTKDQRDLAKVLIYATEARDVAYDLFSRRVDTRRNVNSFILLRDAFILMRQACELLDAAAKQAMESKSSDQLCVADEIGVRSGRLKIVAETEAKARLGDTRADVLSFPAGKKKEDQKSDD